MVRIFKVGDSRTVGQAAARGVSQHPVAGKKGYTYVNGTDNTGTYYYAQVGEGLNWMNKNIAEITEKSKDYDVIVVSLGANDLWDKQKYMAKMNELANGPWKDKQVYFTAVNPFGPTYKGVPNMNQKVDEFNNYVKSHLPSNVHFIDTNTYFKNNCQNCRYDAPGMHYDGATNKKIDAFVTAEIQRDYAQRVGTRQQTTTNDLGQEQTSSQSDNSSTADKMRSDQQRAQEVKEGLTAAESSGNAGNEGALNGLFASDGKGGDDPLAMMFAYALIYALTGEFPGAKKNEGSVQSSGGQIVDQTKQQGGEQIVVDHANGMQLNMSSFDIKSENFARDLARQMTANIGKNQSNPKSYTGYAPAGVAYCAGAGAKSFNEVASKYDVFDMGAATPSCIGARDKLATVYGSNGATSNCQDTIKNKISANPNVPQVFTVFIDNGGISASGLHYVTVAPRLDKNGEIVRNNSGAVQYDVYSFNRDKIYHLENYNFEKRKGYVFPITEMAAQRELARDNTVTAAILARHNEGRA